MKIRLTPPTLEALDDLGPDPQGCLVLTTFADDRPLRGLTGLVDWRLNGQLSRLMRRDFVDGHWLESTLAPIVGRLPFERLLLVGLGRRADFGPQRFEEACRFCFARLNGLGALQWAMPLPGRIGLDANPDIALAASHRDAGLPARPAKTRRRRHIHTVITNPITHHHFEVGQGSKNRAGDRGILIE